MRYLSVCSGISAETAAWHPLGWECAAFSEIDPQASAVLAHQWPGIPNHGDFTTMRGNEYGPVDLVVGGTPCQAFSIAGKRKGMDDPRGDLTLKFVELLSRVRPRWFVWENVTGALSQGQGRAFGAFLGALADIGYDAVWRVFDAQYVRVESHPFAVPQRRKRVIVVGYLGDWRPPCAVLLEPEGMRGDPPPRREAGKDVAGTFTSCASTGGADDNSAQQNHLIPMGFGGGNTSGPIDRHTCLTAHGIRMDFDTETFIVNDVSSPLTCRPYADTLSRENNLVAHTLRGEGCDASEDGAGRGTPIVIHERAASANPGPNGKGYSDGNVAYTLEARSVPQAVFAFSCKDDGRDSSLDVAPTLRAMNFNDSHMNGGGQIAVSVSLRGREGGGAAELSDPVSPALRASQGGGDKQHVLALDIRQDPVSYVGHIGTHGAKTPPHGVLDPQWLVRRITPREAERLMGFPDDYTLVPWRKRMMADGPRYRMLGNSVAVNCLSWLGQRIALWEEIAGPFRTIPSNLSVRI